jgi:hypothetical protein
VETDGHDSIGRVESFFNTITVMDVDIDIYDSLVVPTYQPWTQQTGFKFTSKALEYQARCLLGQLIEQERARLSLPLT